MDALAGRRSNAAFRSYRKTACASVAVAALAILAVIAASTLLPALVALAVGLPVVVAVATVACASVLVLARMRRASRGERDLFLALNRSRETQAIRAAR